MVDVRGGIGHLYSGILLSLGEIGFVGNPFMHASFIRPAFMVSCLTVDVSDDAVVGPGGRVKPVLALFWMWHANNSEHENGYNRVTDEVLWSIEQSTISSARRKERRPGHEGKTVVLPAGD